MTAKEIKRIIGYRAYAHGLLDKCCQNGAPTVRCIVGVFLIRCERCGYHLQSHEFHLLCRTWNESIRNRT